MAMSKKDYVAIADVLNEFHRKSTDPVVTLAVSMIASNLSFVFREDNPRFDTDRFQQAVLRREA